VGGEGGERKEERERGEKNIILMKKESRHKTTPPSFRSRPKSHRDFTRTSYPHPVGMGGVREGRKKRDMEERKEKG
jgi:hypothetical protein